MQESKTTTFDFMAEFINQISDDVLREQLEAALERMMPKQDEELGVPGNMISDRKAYEVFTGRKHGE